MHLLRGYKKMNIVYYPGIVVCENETVRGERFISLMKKPKRRLI